jgi:hypothetical protein
MNFDRVRLDWDFAVLETDLAAIDSRMQLLLVQRRSHAAQISALFGEDKASSDWELHKHFAPCLDDKCGNSQEDVQLNPNFPKAPLTTEIMNVVHDPGLQKKIDTIIRCEQIYLWPSFIDARNADAMRPEAQIQYFDSSQTRSPPPAERRRSNQQRSPTTSRHLAWPHKYRCPRQAISNQWCRALLRGIDPSLAEAAPRSTPTRMPGLNRQHQNCSRRH